MDLGRHRNLRRRAAALVVLSGLALTPDATAQRGTRPAAPPARGATPPAETPSPTRTPPDVRGGTPQIPEARLQTWFSSMDLDGNGWLSLRETQDPLGFDRGRFRAFDLDKDGRLDVPEYRAFYRHELEQGRPPLPPAVSALAAKDAPRRDPQQLRMAFDRDLDGALDVAEFGVLLVAYDRPDVDARVTFAQLDGNGDQRLDVSELPRVSSFVDPILKPSGTSEHPIPRTLEELFGAQEVRGGEGQPPRIAGPVPVFWRLDLDRDGYIEEDDLRALQGRVHLAVSLRAVLSTLDMDGDGRMSVLEFTMSLDPDVRPEGPKPTR